MTSERGGEGEARLPRPPGAIRRAMAEHPRTIDIAIVVCYVLGGAGMLFLDMVAVSYRADGLFGTPAYLVWPWWVIALLRFVAVGAALLLRRTYPLAGVVVATIALLGEQGALGTATSVALFFMIYAVPVYRSTMAGWVGFGIAFTGTVAVYALGLLGQFAPSGATFLNKSGATGLSDLVGFSMMTAVWYLAVLMLGINIGNRRRYVESIIERATQLAVERDQRARLAVAEERSRIAREMHDIVAHSVSVMIALSEGAARAVQAAPDAASDAMQRSAETGRTALAEMRRLLGALQGEESAELAPQPSVRELPSLVQGFRDAGLAVEFELSGEAFGDQSQQLALYRAAQEGLTNALRYAGVGAVVEVRAESVPGRATIEVRDRGVQPGASRPVAGLGSGSGLAGLAERLRVLGGSLEAGPAPGESPGWLLRAELPLANEEAI